VGYKPAEKQEWIMQESNCTYNEVIELDKFKGIKVLAHEEKVILYDLQGGEGVVGVATVLDLDSAQALIDAIEEAIATILEGVNYGTV
jgi:hypothetical protein